MIRFACPSCQAAYSVDDQKAGKKSKCPKCGQRIEVPTPQRDVTSMGILLPDLEDFGNGPQVVEAPAPMGDLDDGLPAAIFLDDGPEQAPQDATYDDWDIDHHPRQPELEQIPLADRDPASAPGNESSPTLPKLLCAKCGRPLVKRFGKMSRSSFLRCAGFDEGICDYTRPIAINDLPAERTKGNSFKPILPKDQEPARRKTQSAMLPREPKPTSNASVQNGHSDKGPRDEWSKRQSI
jgi:predicted Zn finger-like uncharacterized protein